MSAGDQNYSRAAQFKCLSDSTVPLSVWIVRHSRNIRFPQTPGGDLKLLRPDGRVLEVFNELHLLEIIPSFGDETQALASFRPKGYFAKP